MRIWEQFSSIFSIHPLSGQSTCLPAYLFIDRYLSIPLTISIIHLAICLATCTSIYQLFTHLSIYLLINLSFHLFIYPSTCTSAHLSIYDSIHPTRQINQPTQTNKSINQPTQPTNQPNQSINQSINPTQPTKPNNPTTNPTKSTKINNTPNQPTSQPN